MFDPSAAESPSESIAPGFLVASPKLDDTPFERSVVAMVHHDQEGAMGFILNKPLELDFGSVIRGVNDELAPEIEPASFEVPVHFGGPVQVEQLWLMFQRSLGGDEQYREADEELLEKMDRPDDSAMVFGEECYVAASGELIEGFATGDQPGQYRPFMGYCGWGAGQLTDEVEEGSWLMMDFDRDFAFETTPDSCWEEALDVMGVDPTAFMMMGSAGMA